MSESETYEGACHCGTVSFEATTALEPVVSCNCSICQKRGALWNFIPTDQFKLLSGEEALTDYQFNTKAIHHLFCNRCGVASFARGRGPDGKDCVGVNVRCLEGIDLSKLTLTPFDGRSR